MLSGYDQNNFILKLKNCLNPIDREPIGEGFYEWKVENWTKISDKKKVVFSPEFEACGYTWRLKIYVNGDPKVSYSNNYISFYLERLDCSKDYYILESYYSLNDIKASEKYRLDINPIYGDYQIFYFDSFFSNINEIFEQNDIIIEKIEGIMPVMADLSCLKITCKTPTLLNIKYIQQNINLNISEGKEITCSIERNYFPNNFIFITEPSKAYQFNFGFYKNNINLKI